MRRFALALFALLAAPLVMGAGQPAPQRHLELSEADRNALDAISAYLNGFATVKGGFVQIDPDGRESEGTFYISKPGKMRFEYKPPSPTLIVADGHTVAVANRRLNTVDRYSLADTPLNVILGDKIDIRRNPQLVSVQHQQGMIVIGLRTSQNRSKANILLVFSEPNYELREWSVIDDQGLTTTVALRGVTPGAALPATLFVLPQVDPFTHRRQG
jgi:outer membrane lipoprotein-sorting protein